MDQNKTAIERAFDLARSGRFTNASDLKKAVVREGYVGSQLEGRALTRQLTDLIKASNASCR